MAVEAAVISTVFNRPVFTKESFEQLFACTDVEFKHIVVDDVSDEPTQIVLSEHKAQHPEQVVIIRNAENIGNRPSWNKGVEYVFEALPDVPYLVTADNDVSYKNGWLEHGIKVFEIFGSLIKIGIVCLHDDPLYKVERRVEVQGMTIGTKDCTPSWNWIMQTQFVRNVAGVYKGGLKAGRYDRDHKYCRRLHAAGYPVVALLSPGPFVRHEGAEKSEAYTSVDRNDPYRRGKQPIDRGPTG